MSEELLQLISDLKLSEKDLFTMIRGYAGEKKVREWFKENKIPFMQVDIMFFTKDEWKLGEIKSQEKFVSPPFDGHGLPKWQVDRRLDFCNKMKIDAFLIVHDREEECLYIESLNKLNEGEKYYTKGLSPRVIYPIVQFKRLPLQGRPQ